MRHSQRHSLERRLLFTLALAALAFSIVAGGVLYHYSYGHEVARSRHNLDSLAATVQSSASIAVFIENDEIAGDVMEGLLRNDEILAVSLESDVGYQNMRWGDEPVEAWTEGNEVTYALDAPMAPSWRIGTLRLIPDTELVTTRARDAARVQVLALVGHTLGLALIGVFAFRRLVGRPLHLLTRQLRVVSPGSSKRISVPHGHAGSEIGLLASSFNTYLDASEHAITAERKLRERVETMETHYRRIFDSTKVGVLVLDMDGRLINCNSLVSERIERIDEAVGADGADVQDFLARVFARPDKAWALIERAAASGQVATADLELRGRGNGWHWVHCLFSISRTQDQDYQVIEGVLYDVTSRREREQAALRTAERDALTDLINRRGAESYIDRALIEAHRNETGLTLLYIDLDGFKETNDTWGHAAGDAVLMEVARRLAAILRRSSDLLARLGGDEFVIAAYGCQKNDEAIAEFARAILDVLGKPIDLGGGHAVSIGVSIGVASYPEDGLHRSALVFSADQAMYEAKKRGKNCYVLADAQQTPRAD